MTRVVTSVPPESALEDIVDEMRTQRISCMVVCMDEHPVGIVTERDVTRLLFEVLTVGKSSATVREVMSTPILTVSVDDSVADAVAVTQQHNIRHLPVVDDAGTLIGIVTQSDLFRTYSRQMEELVAERTAALANANRQLELLSRLDPLLEIGNRRAMDEALAHVHRLAQRYGRPYAIMLCDLDYFKPYNDSRGHLEGDEALRAVAKRVKEVLRTTDQTFRYGGEEMLLLLPETAAGPALEAAERVRRAIEEMALPHERSPLGIVTVSCGVSGIDSGQQAMGLEWSDVVRSADQALYEAKHQGRNRICAASKSDAP